jgi:hypothetical protein
VRVGVPTVLAVLLAISYPALALSQTGLTLHFTRVHVLSRLYSVIFWAIAAVFSPRSF